ncbi:MAG TPA: HEAT repeat domain-containing protein, partial [Polyangiaceae bacterium]|nr:HEAT repeat domain-containing protein [Polyangiaceae bacterium]
MSDPETRRLAALALAEDTSDEAPKSIARALADSNWRVRKEAAQSAAMSPRRADVLRELLAALGDRDDVGLRNSAVEALVAIGPDAVPTAIAALRTLDADGRKLAVEVLGGVPDARSAEALASALSDEDPNVRQSAAEALGTSAMGGEEARKIAVKALKSVLPQARAMMSSPPHGDAMLVIATLGALSRIGVPYDWKLLEPLTLDPVLRTEALAAAAKCADPSAGIALVDALFDANIAQARTALVALAEWI